MKLHYRIESQNLTHTRATLFVNGENAGALTMRNDEWTVYLYITRLGLRENELVVTSLVPLADDADLTEHP